MRSVSEPNDVRGGLRSTARSTAEQDRPCCTVQNLPHSAGRVSVHVGVGRIAADFTVCKSSIDARCLCVRHPVSYRVRTSAFAYIRALPCETTSCKSILTHRRRTTTPTLTVHSILSCLRPALRSHRQHAPSIDGPRNGRHIVFRVCLALCSACCHRLLLLQ